MRKGWEIRTLGEVCNVQLGKTPFRKNPKFWDKEKVSGNIWLSISDLVHGRYISESFEQITNLATNGIVKIPKGTLMLSFKLTLGRVSFAGCDLYTNEAIASLLSLSKDILKEYLFYYFTLFDWGKEAEGDVKVKGKTLNKKKLNNLKVIVPPLSEQKRIVSILDRAFAAIDKAKANTEKNLQNAKELFENYLQEVFENREEDWEEKKLGEIATFRNGINYTKSSKGEEIKIVGVKDFQNNFWIPLKELDSVVLNGRLAEIDELKENDIIAVRSNGNPALIGRTLLAGKVKSKISHSGFTIRIRLNSNEILPVYLCRYLKTKKTRKELVEKGNGVGIRSLNQGSLSSLSIPFPKSKREQQTIVCQLDTLRAETQKLEAVYQKKMDDLEELKKSILQKAFNGELKTATLYEEDVPALSVAAELGARYKRAGKTGVKK